MTRPRFLKNPRMTQVVLEGDDLDKFVKTLPRDKSVSEALREYIQSCNSEYNKEQKKEKNEEACIDFSPTKGLFINNKSNQLNQPFETEIIPTLDKYIDWAKNINDFKILTHHLPKMKQLYLIVDGKTRGMQKRKW